MHERTVLLVDDDEDNLLLAIRAFKSCRAPASLLVAQSAVEAISLLADTATPSLIVLDVHMPIQDGFELLGLLRREERFRFVPIVIFSSSSLKGDIQRAFELGCTSYVQKPIVFDHFVPRLAKVFDYWLLENLGPSLESSCQPPIYAQR